VLEALKAANLTLKLSKYFFDITEVAYLGFMLSSDGVRLGEQKMLDVGQFPRPQTNRR